MCRDDMTPRVANTNIRLDRLVNASGNANLWRREAASSSSREEGGGGGRSSEERQLGVSHIAQLI